jgi:glycosyltransferase 2 family protein
MDKKKIWNITKLIFKLCLTTLLIWLVFQKINYEQVKSVFRRSNPLFIFFALVLLLLSQVVSSWRLMGFLHAGGIPISFRSNLRLYFLGLFYNNFLPGGIGGDGYKIYFLRNTYKKPVKSIFLSIILDRISGLCAICIIGSLFLWLLQVWFISNYSLLLIIVLVAVLYYMLIRYFLPGYAEYFLTGHLKAIIAQSLQVLSIVMILLSQHFSGSFTPYLFSFLLSSIAAAVPVSIGGAGIREYVMLNIATVLPIDATLAVFMTLTFYILSLLVSAPGLWYVWKKSHAEDKPG